MLAKEEQEALYIIIASTLGEDPVIKALTMSFTERTVEVTETIITENAKCNGAFRELLAALAGAGAIMTKGWLRKILKSSSKLIKKVSSGLKATPAK